MWVLAVVAVLAAAPEFQVRDSDGKALVGELTRCSAESLTILGPAGETTFALSRLASLEAVLAPARPPAAARAWVELVDGSVVPAVSFSATKGQASVVLPGGATLAAPIKSLDVVRLCELDAALADQWASLRAEDRAGDMLVLRKKSTLDYVTGELGSVDDQAVEFKVDGESRSVKLTRVEGLLYLRRAPAKLPEAAFALVDAAGARWQVASAERIAEGLRIETPAGVRHIVPLAEVAALEFKVQYLSDLKPETAVGTPYLTDLALGEALAATYAPRFDENWRGEPLLLDGVRHAKGLALRSKGEVAYRLPPGKFSRLQALAGIDDSVRPNGSCVLQILGDDKPLVEIVVSGAESPQPIDISVAGVRRLRIVVDYGDDLDVSDCLDLADARLLP